MASATVSVSTPGKVLVCGGYVVLNGGASLVLSTSSRFHSTITATSTPATTPTEASIAFRIILNSPQFGKSWIYQASWTPSSNAIPKDFSFKDSTEKPSSGNIYVESALLYCLATAATHPEALKITASSYELNITVQADNDFYSHSKAVRKRTFANIFMDKKVIEGIKMDFLPIFNLAPFLTICPS